ncbi:MAG TPA: D-alanyl-D-alanine carboxypeptidase family protein [Nevskia sp.]|nr:D-alanyl-D-alanine carboxypeptidase family protein [Nevskia sp.]
MNLKSGLLGLAIALFSLSGPALADAPTPPPIDGYSYGLMDYQSGEIVAGQNLDAHVAPASITKVMTVYVAFDMIKQGRLKLSDTALVSEKAWSEGKDSSESRMFLSLGSRVSIEDLLRGIIIVSGNDASVALAEHIAGSEDAFAQVMNQYAQKLGMTNTHFVDASGMPNDQHYTSARDLLTLAHALIQNFPEDYKYFSEKEFKYGIEHPQQNRNGLLFKDPSVDGIKTGHTAAAGYCLLASARRDGRRLISVVMGGQSWAYREQANQELLNYGFRNFDTASVLGAAAPVQTARVYKGADTQVGIGTLDPVYLALPAGEKSQLQVQPQVAAKLVAPLTAGQKVGEATILVAGKELKKVPLVVLKDVPAGGFWHRLIDQIKLWLGL